MNNLSGGRKYRAMARTIPGQIGVVPAEGAARVSAGCRQRTKASVGRSVYGKLRFAAFDDAALAAWNLIDAVDKGMRVVAFVVILRAVPPGIIKFGPWIRAVLNLVTDQEPGGCAIADSSAIEPGGNIKSFRLFFGLADIGHAIRSVVILVEPAPCRLEDFCGPTRPAGESGQQRRSPVP